MSQRPFAAFLRGISPMNAKMSELRAAFEAAGFSDVKSVLGSGNLVFRTSSKSETVVERKAEAAMREILGQSFLTIVRRIESLAALIEGDPFAAFRLRAGSKRIVSFLRSAPIETPRLPIEKDGARIVSLVGSDVFSAYVPSPRGPVFMSLIEKTFGTEITTRTWETVKKVVAASQRG